MPIIVKEVDLRGFYNLAKTLESFQLLLQSSALDPDKDNYLLEEQINAEFPYLLGCLDQRFSSFFSDQEVWNQSCFIGAVHKNHDEEKLVGFTCIRHFNCISIEETLLLHLEEKGNIGSREYGYDYTTATSVHRDWRNQHILHMLRRKAAQSIIERHKQRGGSGTALMKIK